MQVCKNPRGVLRKKMQNFFYKRYAVWLRKRNQDERDFYTIHRIIIRYLHRLQNPVSTILVQKCRVVKIIHLEISLRWKRNRRGENSNSGWKLTIYRHLEPRVAMIHLQRDAAQDTIFSLAPVCPSSAIFFAYSRHYAYLNHWIHVTPRVTHFHTRYFRSRNARKGQSSVCL